MTALERRSVASLATLYMFRMLGLFMVLPLLALYAADMPGATATLIGVALGVYGLAQALLQIPLGWLSDHLGRKPIIVGGLLLFAVGSVVAAVADSVWGIILGRTLQGAGAIAGTVMALVADLTREEQRTKAMALVGISIGLSFAVALVLGPAIAALQGLAGVFWFTGALALAGIAVLLLWVPAPPGRQSAQLEVGLRRGMIGRSLLDPSLARLNFGIFSLHFVLVSAFLVLPGMLEDGAGVDRADHWMVYLPALVLSLAGMVPLMRYAERAGRPREAILVAIAALVATLVILGLGATRTVLYIGLWLFFVGFNYLEATLPSMVSKVASPDGKGTAMGVYSTCQFLGVFGGGALGGFLVQHLGSAGLSLACVSLLVAWGLWVMLAPPAPVAIEEISPGAEV